MTEPPVLSGLSSSEIDAAVAAGASSRTVAVERLAACRPDVVLCQDLCSVCAPGVAEVQEAIGDSAKILAFSPTRLEEVLDLAVVLGDSVGLGEAGRRLRSELGARLGAVSVSVRGSPLPVVALEWLDPPYRVGHWIPDQIQAAGGVDLLGRAGEKAVPVDLDEVLETEPELIVLMPCGFDAKQTRERAESEGLLGRVAARRGGPAVIAADADAHFSRPGPRLVDGVEWLAPRLASRGGRSRRAALR